MIVWADLTPEQRGQLVDALATVGSAPADAADIDLMSDVPPLFVTAGGALVDVNGDAAPLEVTINKAPAKTVIPAGVILAGAVLAAVIAWRSI